MNPDDRVRTEHHARTTGQIRRALHKISTHYPNTFDPGRLADDSEHHHPHASGEPLSLDHVQARAEAERDIRYWAHFTIDELDGGPTTATVHASDILACITLIDRWADHIVTRHPDDASNLRRDMTRHATNLERIALSLRRRRIKVGPCPETTDVDDQPTRCPGTLHALLDEQPNDLEDGKVDLLPARVECDTCGHHWTPWEWRDLGRRVTA